MMDRKIRGERDEIDNTWRKTKEAKVFILWQDGVGRPWDEE